MLCFGGASTEIAFHSSSRELSECDCATTDRAGAARPLQQLPRAPLRARHGGGPCAPLAVCMADKLRACLAAEAWLPVGGNASNCRAVAPPDEAGELGWQGVSVGNMSRRKVHEMLERWLCWH